MADTGKAARLALKSSPQTRDKDLLKKEILFAAKLQLFSAALGLAKPAPGLDSVIKEYKNVWLRRNRRGGLADSVSRLEKLKEFYFKANG